MSRPHLHSVPENAFSNAADIPLQPASEDIWDKKYRLKTKDGSFVDHSVDDTFKRVARALSEVENEDQQDKWNELFLWALRHGAIPAGRITSNAGAREHKPATSTINCTVSGTIGDSMDNILNKVHEAGLTLKAGCGIGYEFSTLRAKGAYVSGAGAYTSGPMSFMDIYDKMCFTVSSAGGRRGAQMATFDVGHPDVIEFIRAKREDGRLRQFNLSLLITEEFMEAVKHERDWELAFPVSAKEAEEDGLDLRDTKAVVWRDWPEKGDYIANESGKVACRIYKTLPARRVWDVIMASTYDYAEPGFILIDKVNEMNNNWFCEDIRATNPCVTPDTWVQTSEGPKQVEELIGQQFTARVDGKDWLSGPEGFFKTSHKAVMHLNTAEGYNMRLTPDHRVRRVTRFTRYATETEWCEAKKLRVGDRVLLNDHTENARWSGAHNQSEGYLLGLLVGEGELQAETAVLSVWSHSAVIGGHAGGLSTGTQKVMEAALTAARDLPRRSELVGWRKVDNSNEYRLHLGSLRKLAADMGLERGNTPITADVEGTSSTFHIGFIRGLFDAHGSVQGSQEHGVSVRLPEHDIRKLEATQRMLLRLGVASRIYRDRRKAGAKRGTASRYHELVISGANLKVFSDTVGFADTDKQTRLSDAMSGYKRELNRERFVARVTEVEVDGIEDVYDVQVPGINAFDANGIHAHNCGEQPLPPYGSCLLGSINLTKFVRNAFTAEASFDWDEYRKVIDVFTRMLDNVVEINGLPLEQQRNEIESKRRHGMGFLGLGSTITMLGMKYGTTDSLSFTDEITKTLAIEGWKSALELGKEKGPAPIMNKNFTVTTEMLAMRPEMSKDGWKVGKKIKGKVLHAKYSRYMQRIAEVEPELVAELAKVGARFTHHSSIAPTGTISLSLANNASNGIEPSFAHHYARNVIREGKKSKEKVNVYSFELLAYRELVNAKAMPFSEEEGAELPEYFISADDIGPKEHVDVQAAAQKWIDSSISKTANVPTDYPYEDFKDIYLYAYEQGLKGCTTFRFNPEVFQGVLVKEQDLENTLYKFTLEDGSQVEVKGNEEIEYDGETHTAANLYDALKEGYYGKF